MIRKWNSLLLIVLLTFLQCLAPLLHAHAGGIHAGDSGHLHLDKLSEVSAPLRVHTEFRVDLSDSPSVSAPTELRRDQPLPGGESGGLPVSVITPLPASGGVVWVALPALFDFLSPRLTPPAQAPPAAI
jgi:hypothetical protein